MVDFHVQLSENTEENKLMDVFKKTLRTSNFSLGGTELFAAREADNLEAQGILFFFIQNLYCWQF